MLSLGKEAESLVLAVGRKLGRFHGWQSNLVSIVICHCQGMITFGVDAFRKIYLYCMRMSVLLIYICSALYMCWYVCGMYVSCIYTSIYYICNILYML